MKALPKPEEKPRKKRGGQKYRSMKARLEMTMQRKMRNTVAFGTAAQHDDMYTGETFGVAGQQDAGVLRAAPVKEKKLQPRKRDQKSAAKEQ